MHRRSSLFLRAACAAATIALPWAGASPAAAATPNDPHFGSQWGLSKIGAPTAWDTGTGQGVTIAIVDSGIDAGHPDLAGKVAGGYNFVSPGSAPHDDNSHGTHVAGIAAAVTFNATGVAGTAPGARLLAVKVLDSGGSGTSADAGIRYATDSGAKVINLSLGGYAQGITGASLGSPCAYAFSRGALCVASAGNDYVTGSGYEDDDVLVVSASDCNDGKPTYSSGVGNAKWGIAAPGGGSSLLGGSCSSILSTIPGGGYGGKSGTSMAAPHVSGAAAALFGLGLSNQQVVDRLLSTATDIGSAGRDSTFGAGRLNFSAAVAGLSRPAPPPPSSTTSTTAATTSTTAATTTTSTSTTTPGSTTTTTQAQSTTTTAPSDTTTTTAPAGDGDGSSPTTAAPSGSVRRIAGADRIETAVAASMDAFPNSASAVVLSRADSFADALAGTPLAVHVNGPLLLTQHGSLDPRTRAEIQRILSAGGRIHLLGGPVAIGDAVDSELRGLGYTTSRYAGTDRFETAVRIAADGLGDPDTFLLANGIDFHDALVAGAAAPRVGGAVLLTFGSTLPRATTAHLGAHPGARRYAVGRLAAEADRSALALYGADPQATSRRVAEVLTPHPVTVGIASAATFPDAMGGGAHAARRGGPLLLTDPRSLSPVVAEFLRAERTAIERGFVYGGGAAVAEEVRTAAERDIN